MIFLEIDRLILRIVKNGETIYFRDISDGGSCKTNPMTGMPDSNCLFFISTTNNDDVTSSYMAVPFLPNVSYHITFAAYIAELF